MNKISINLNPRKEAVSSSILQNFIAYTPLAAMVTAFVFVILVLMQVVIVKKMHTHHVYTDEWKHWESKAVVIRDIKAAMATLESELVNLRDTTTPKYNMGLILKDMFASLPKNIWFESFRFKEETIDLKGYVVKWNEDLLVSLGTFIDSLRDKKYFSSKFPKVNIKTSQKTDFNGIKVLKFFIECKK